MMGRAADVIGQPSKFRVRVWYNPQLVRGV